MKSEFRTLNIFVLVSLFAGFLPMSTAAALNDATVSATKTDFSASPTYAKADGVSEITAIVYAKNESGVPLADKNVEFTVNSDSGFYSLLKTEVTNDAGLAYLHLTRDNFDKFTVSARVDGADLNYPLTVYFTATGATPPVALMDANGGGGYGSLFKESGKSTIYYYGMDEKKHVFPTQAIYLSWYQNWTGINSLSHETATAIPLGANVTPKPLTSLIQFVSADTPFQILDNKVYAIDAWDVSPFMEDPLGAWHLRWLKSADAAAAIYGANWEGKIVPVPEIFRDNYPSALGAEINSASDYSTKTMFNFSIGLIGLFQKK
jgi:hypothetical protein